MKLFAWLTLLCLLPSSFVPAMAQTAEEFKEVYPAEFISDYSQECVQTSMGEGLEAPEAETLCGCTIAEFQKQYTLDEFKEITAASATDETAENSLIEVGQICFESILYEQ